MKAKNGGKGMSDSEVEAFVSRYACISFSKPCLTLSDHRYMPGYELFGSGVQSGGQGKLPPWSSKGLSILVDRNRAVAAVSRF